MSSCIIVTVKYWELEGKKLIRKAEESGIRKKPFVVSLFIPSRFTSRIIDTKLWIYLPFQKSVGELKALQTSSQKLNFVSVEVVVQVLKHNVVDISILEDGSVSRPLELTETFSLLY